MGSTDRPTDRQTRRTTPETVRSSSARDRPHCLELAAAAAKTLVGTRRQSEAFKAAAVHTEDAEGRSARGGSCGSLWAI